MKAKRILSATLIGGVMSLAGGGFGIAAFILTMLFGGGANGMVNTSIFDPSGLTLNSENAKATAEMIYEKKFMSPAWSEFMDLYTGIVHDKQIPILGNFNGLAGSVRENCDTTPNASTISNTEKTWTPKLISDRFEECYEPLEATFWKWFLKPGVEKSDLTGTEYEAFIVDRISNYMSDDMIMRLLFFTSTTISSGTTNNISSGDLKFFNMIDGIFKQLETITAADTTKRVTISENAQSTYSGQQFATPSTTVHPVTDYLDLLTVGNGTTILPSMELRGEADQIILVTQSVADQYFRERKAAGDSAGVAYQRTESGMTKFQYNGIDIVAIPTWDRLIRRHFDNGTKWTNPHRMLYTTKTNLAVGVEDAGTLKEFKSEYSSYNEKWFAKFTFKLDTKVKLDQLVMYGY